MVLAWVCIIALVKFGQAGLIWVPAVAGFVLYAGSVVLRSDRWQLHEPPPKAASLPGEHRQRAVIPPAVKAAVWRRCGGKCQHCDMTDAQSMAATGIHLLYDHIIPWSWGGPDTEDNLQLLCDPCNRAKGNRYVG